MYRIKPLGVRNSSGFRFQLVEGGNTREKSVTLRTLPDEQKLNLKPFPHRQIGLPQLEIIKMSSVASLERKEQVKDNRNIPITHFASSDTNR